MPGNVYRIRLFRVIGSEFLMLTGVFVGNKGYFKSIDFPYFPLGLKNLKSAGVKSVPVRVRSAAPRRRSLRTAQKTRFRKSRVFFGCAPGLLLLPTRPAPLGSRGVPDWKPAAFRFRRFLTELRKLHIRSIPPPSPHATRSAGLAWGPLFPALTVGSFFHTLTKIFS